MKKPPVSQTAKMRPLLSIQETKMLRAEGALNQPVKGPKKTYENGIPHSMRAYHESQRYHARLLTGRQSAAKATDQLNPDRTIKQVRSYPGLAN